MTAMLVSEFKAKCIAALKEIQRTREPMLITLRGKPLATIQPVAPHGPGKRLGGLKGLMTIRRDLVTITGPSNEAPRRGQVSSSEGSRCPARKCSSPPPGPTPKSVQPRRGC